MSQGPYRQLMSPDGGANFEVLNLAACSSFRAHRPEF